MREHLGKVLNAAVILCALAQLALSTAIQPPAQLPAVDKQFLVPQPVGHVNDFAGKLSPAVRQQLEAQIESFISRSNVGFSVVVMNQADLRNWTIEAYTRRLANEWGVARPPQKFGVVLLVAIGSRDEKKIYHGATRLEVSRALEDYLSNALAAQLIRAMRPDFQAGRFDQALTVGAQSVMATLAEKLNVALNDTRATPARSTPPSSDYSIPPPEGLTWSLLSFLFSPFSLVVFLALIVIALIVIFIKRSTSGDSWGGGYRRNGATWFGQQSSWNNSAFDDNVSHWSSTDSTGSNDYSSMSSSWSSDTSSASDSWTSSDAGSSSSDFGSSSSSDFGSSSSSDFGSSSSGDFGGGGSSDSW